MDARDSQLALLLAPDVEELLSSGDPAEAAAALEEFHPADVADIAQRVSRENRTRLIKAMPPERAAEVMEYLDSETGTFAITQLSPEAAADVLEQMSADDRADLLESLPSEVAEPMLAAVEPEARKETQQLLKYEPNTAGGLMTPAFVRLPPDVNVGEAIARIRRAATTKETVYAAYITNTEGRLLGVASLRELLASDDAVKISEVMTERVVSVGVNADQEEVARIFARYDLLAVPVVEAGIILGIVTVDDVLDVLVEEGTEDVQRIGAVEPLDVPYFSASVGAVIRSRAIWLAVIFLGEAFTGTVLKEFEEELARFIALVMFIPLIISSGGNAGSQSSTLIIRGLAVGEVHLSDFARIFRKELAAGVGLGIVLGLIGAVRGFIGGFEGAIILTVSITLVIIVTMGTVLGSLMPLGLRRLGLDPALTSAPAIASLIDVGGIFAYLTVARFILF